MPCCSGPTRACLGWSAEDQALAPALPFLLQPFPWHGIALTSSIRLPLFAGEDWAGTGREVSSKGPKLNVRVGCLFTLFQENKNVTQHLLGFEGLTRQKGQGLGGVQ